MSKGIVPIVEINNPRLMNLDIEELMESVNVKGEDEFTYTTRYTVTDDKTKDHIRAVLAENVESKIYTQEQVDKFLKVMDDNGWDVSFLVDCY